MTTGVLAPPRRRRATTELVAVLLMTVGSILIPVIGWLVGVVLLWFSPLLRWWEKLLATLVVPGGLGAVLIAGLGGSIASPAVAQTCSSAMPIGRQEPNAAQGYTMRCTSSGPSDAITVLIGIAALLLLIAPIVLDVWLYRRAAVRSQDSTTAY